MVALEYLASYYLNGHYVKSYYEKAKKYLERAFLIYDKEVFCSNLDDMYCIIYYIFIIILKKQNIYKDLECSLRTLKYKILNKTVLINLILNLKELAKTKKLSNESIKMKCIVRL